ncbi:LOC34620909, partial [Symbiodinium pilosum]
MLSGPVRVQPEIRYVAEVVVLVTTLGAKRVEYNAGKRARDLLEIKGVHHKVIDFNRDARQAGTGDAENKAIQKLMEDRRLQTGGNNDLILPQVFIDGNYVGNASDLQGLEDDDLLENILLRRVCVRCGSTRRTPDMTQCPMPACGASYQEILPGEMTISQALQELAHHDDDFDDEYYEDGEEEFAEEDDVMPTVTKSFTEFPEERRARMAGYGGGAAAGAPDRLGQSQGLPMQATQLPLDPALQETARFALGEQVQYWSDSKNRWMDAVVEGIRLKEGSVVYDL